MKIKKFLFGATCGFILGMGITSFAANQYVQVLLNTKIKLSVNGEIKTMSDATTGEIEYPLTYKDRTYIPLRSVATLLGANVDYDGITNTAIVNSADYKKEDNDTVQKDYKVISTNNIGYLGGGTFRDDNCKITITDRNGDKMFSHELEVYFEGDNSVIQSATDFNELTKPKMDCKIVYTLYENNIVTITNYELLPAFNLIDDNLEGTVSRCWRENGVTYITINDNEGNKVVKSATVEFDVLFTAVDNYDELRNNILNDKNIKYNLFNENVVVIIGFGNDSDDKEGSEQGTEISVDTKYIVSSEGKTVLSEKNIGKISDFIPSLNKIGITPDRGSTGFEGAVDYLSSKSVVKDANELFNVTDKVEYTIYEDNICVITNIVKDVYDEKEKYIGDFFGSYSSEGDLVVQWSYKVSTNSSSTDSAFVDFTAKDSIVKDAKDVSAIFSYSFNYRLTADDKIVITGLCGKTSEEVDSILNNEK